MARRNESKKFFFIVFHIFMTLWEDDITDDADFAHTSLVAVQTITEGGLVHGQENDS